MTFRAPTFLSVSSNSRASVVEKSKADSKREGDTTSTTTLAAETTPEQDDEFLKGFAVIGFITFLNASLAPVWHVVFEGSVTPPPLFLNAIVSLTALTGLLVGGPFLDANTSKQSNLAEAGEEQWSRQSWRGGMELGLWKGLGTCCLAVY